MKKLILPGWAIPCEKYKEYNYDTIADYGFFNSTTENAINCSTQSFSEINLQDIISDDTVIIAHSLGSLTALRNSQKTDKIKGMVLIGGFSCFTQIKGEYPYGQEEKKLKMMINMMGLAHKMVLNKFYEGMYAPEQAVSQDFSSANRARLIEGLKFLMTEDLRNILPEIEIPVLIIHGKEDKIVSYQLGEFMKNNIKNSTVEYLENTGHAAPFTKTSEIKNSIKKFINSL